MHRSSSPARLALTACLAATLASCGGGDSDSVARSSANASGGRAQRLSLPPGTTIPADAPTKGLFGPLQTWPLIAVHGVLTSDGRVLSYGSRGDGLQTGNFIYDVWNPSDGSHLTMADRKSVV